MRAEYLLFNLVVLCGPLALSLWPTNGLRPRAWSMAQSALLVAVPFLAWDAAVTGRHWWFDSRYTLGLELGPLPVEEVLFFFTVPFACLFAWETLVPRTPLRAGPLGSAGYAVAFALIPAGFAVFELGREYTGLVLLALGLSGGLDHALGTGLLRRRRFWVFAGVVVVLTAVFNTYLTARPVVHYGPEFFVGLRVGTVPVEDFGYGVALITANLVVYQWLEMRGVQPSWVARAIERAFGGYRHLLRPVDAGAPYRVGSQRRVLVAGGGLAGLSSASMLAARGFEVTLVERNAYLGGKVGAWTETLEDGAQAQIEHGFHAFFRHYYNLNDWLDTIGVRRSMQSVGEYTIATADGRRLRFADRREAPVLNLINLARRGLYRLGPVARGPAGREMEAFLRYEADSTFKRFDELPFSTFAARARLPRDLRTVFNAFSRAFFADDDRLSTAELIKSFHFYYLSHDHGLGYDFVAGGYREKLIDPIVRHCADLGVQIRTRTAVESLEPQDDGRWEVDGETYDAVVVATDVGAAGAILGRSRGVRARAPQLIERFAHVRPGQRYAVLRLWVDRPVPTDLPVFVSTERRGALDAAAWLDRIDPAAAAWAAESGGGVVELHCYAVPDSMADEDVRESLVDGMRHFFAELADARVLREHLQIRHDFTAFHVGMGQHRPGVETELPGLFLAGDWVKLPCPAMLMEAAHTSGRLAANAIASREGLQEDPVYTVPIQGLLARLPERPPARATQASA